MLNISLSDRPEFVLSHHRRVGLERNVLTAADFHEILLDEKFGNQITAQTPQEINIDHAQLVLLAHGHIPANEMRSSDRASVKLTRARSVS